MYSHGLDARIEGLNPNHKIVLHLRSDPLSRAKRAFMVAGWVREMASPLIAGSKGAGKRRRRDDQAVEV